MTDDEQKMFLETLSAVLLRCAIISLGLLYFWFALYLFTGNTGYTVQSRWFPLTQHDFVLVNYSGMAFMKILILLFFLIPYLSIRWVLRKKQNP